MHEINGLLKDCMKKSMSMMTKKQNTQDDKSEERSESIPVTQPWFDRAYIEGF